MVSKKQRRAKERRDRKVRLGWVLPLTCPVPPFSLHLKDEGYEAHYFNKGCCHGCTFVPPPDHALSAFMNQFYTRLLSLTLYSDIIHEVWKSESSLPTDPDLRSKATSLLLRLGISTALKGLLDSEGFDFDFPLRVKMLGTVMLLIASKIQCQPHEDHFVLVNYSELSRTMRKLLHGNTRDILKYLHKQAKKVSCNCLRPFYLVYRIVCEKRAICHGCNEVMARKDLMVCRCGLDFCSRECQKAVWQEHKPFCQQGVVCASSYCRVVSNSRDDAECAQEIQSSESSDSEFSISGF